MAFTIQLPEPSQEPRVRVKRRNHIVPGFTFGAEELNGSTARPYRFVQGFPFVRFVRFVRWTKRRRRGFGRTVECHGRM